MQKTVIGLLAWGLFGLCASAQQVEKLGDASWALLSEDPRSSNSVVFAGVDSVLLVDPGRTPAEALARIELAESLSGKPVEKVLLTSADPACALGVLLLEARDFEVLCHGETRRYLAEHAAEMLRVERLAAKSPEEAAVFDARRFRLPDRSILGLPGRSILREESFGLGAHFVVASAVGPARTRGDLVVRSAKDRVIALGSLGFGDRFPMIPEDANLRAWTSVFADLPSTPLASAIRMRYVATRGKVFGQKELEAARQYFEALVLGASEAPLLVANWKAAPEVGCSTFSDNKEAAAKCLARLEVLDETGALGIWRLRTRPYAFDVMVASTASNGTRVTVSGHPAELDLYRGKEHVCQFAIGRDPAGLALTQDGRLAFVPLLGEGLVACFDLYNEERLPDVMVGEGVGFAALTENDADLVFPLTDSRKLVFVNTASREVAFELTQGLAAKPSGIAVSPNRRFGLVWYEGSGTLTLVDLKEKRVVAHETIKESIRTLRFDGDQLEVLTEGPPGAVAFGIPLAWRTKPVPATTPTKVAVMGMIHTGHLTSELWGLEQVADTIRRFKPDAVLVEIPPDRWGKAWDDFTVRGVVEEPRVKVFAEYREMMFDLSVELGFEIVPCAGWTKPMNDLRRTRSREFNEDEEWAEARAELERISAEVEARWEGSPVHDDDPHVIHSAEYDRYVREVMDPVGRLQNDMIDPGGWYNINRAHMRLVHQAIDARPEQRLLVTFGAFHKYMFLDELREREDVQLVDLEPYLDE